MRLLVDLQCVQSTSAVRGIGRYALSLTAALARTAGADDRVEVLLNGGDDPVRLLRARTALETFLPARAVHVFDAPWPWQHDPSDARRREAEAVREAAVASLDPDALLVGSVFEGDQETVLSIPSGGVPTAALLYDLIPAADPGTYLLGPGADSYWRRYGDLQRADLLLSISDYSGRQARQLLGDACPPVTPVWGGPYPSGLFEAFETRAVTAPPTVPAAYLLSVGGDHPRKNLDRLVRAWGRVPDRGDVALVVACRLNVGTLRRLRRVARQAGLGPDDLVLTGEVSEDALTDLYRRAVGFVFPSTEEGLGLPPLEAMAVECPTVLSTGSSLSELVDDPEAYFDGTDVDAMAAAMTRLLADAAFRARLRAAAARSTERFTWERSAQLSWAALRDLAGLRRPVPSSGASPVVVTGPPPPESDAALVEAERGLGVRGPLPAGTRTALASAPGLVVTDGALARALVASGLVEQPVVATAAPVAHDLYAQVRARVGTSVAPADLVRALAFPPRWMLERPWPVWLVLAQDPQARGVDPAGPVVVVGGAGAAFLARSVDRVVVEGALVPALEPDLHRARCLGTRVTVVGGNGPAWADTAATLDEALHADGERTTGWPWRG